LVQEGKEQERHAEQEASRLAIARNPAHRSTDRGAAVRTSSIRKVKTALD